MAFEGGGGNASIQFYSEISLSAELKVTPAIRDIKFDSKVKTDIKMTGGQII